MDWISHELLYGSGWQTGLVAGVLLLVAGGSEVLLVVFGKRFLLSDQKVVAVIGFMMLSVVCLSLLYVLIVTIAVLSIPDNEW